MDEDTVRCLVDELLQRDWGSLSFDQNTEMLGTKNFAGKGYRGTRGWIRRDCQFPRHDHSYETWTYTIAGRARLFEDGKALITLIPGQLICTPAGTIHRSAHDAGYEGFEIEIVD